MTAPLPDNPAHIEFLRSQLGIATPTRKLSRVFGGFHHRVWRLDTRDRAYAIKQLAPDTDLNDPDTTNHYDRTEAIAEAFAGHGIAAVFALKRRSRYLQIIGSEGYLVYPWSDARAIEKDCISEKHALKVARLLASMHRADIDVPEPRQTQAQVYQQQEIIDLVNLAIDRNIPEAVTLRNHLPIFLSAADSHGRTRKILEGRLVISHGDLDQKNILWQDSGHPLIIDWESARKLNPSYEILLEALDWSGITAQFEPELFEKMLSCYIASGGKIEEASLEAAFSCILNEWLGWLLYNLGRTVYLDDVEQRSLGGAQVKFALTTLMRLHRLTPELIRSAKSQISITC